MILKGKVKTPESSYLCTTLILRTVQSQRLELCCTVHILGGDLIITIELG